MDTRRRDSSGYVDKKRIKERSFKRDSDGEQVQACTDKE